MDGLTKGIIIDAHYLSRNEPKFATNKEMDNFWNDIKKYVIATSSRMAGIPRNDK